MRIVTQGKPPVVPYCVGGQVQVRKVIGQKGHADQLASADAGTRTRLAQAQRFRGFTEGPASSQPLQIGGVASSPPYLQTEEHAWRSGASFSCFRKVSYFEQQGNLAWPADWGLVSEALNGM